MTAVKPSSACCSHKPQVEALHSSALGLMFVSSSLWTCDANVSLPFNAVISLVLTGLLWESYVSFSPKYKAITAREVS